MFIYILLILGVYIYVIGYQLSTVYTNGISCYQQRMTEFIFKFGLFLSLMDNQRHVCPNIVHNTFVMDLSLCVYQCMQGADSYNMIAKILNWLPDFTQSIIKFSAHDLKKKKVGTFRNKVSRLPKHFVVDLENYYFALTNCS